ncbi:hypothetical protein ASC77_09340 [Nocardioides sp. Root1257]|uniref:hypothetical protein n=1 Tax=unclassified Nocardioides TaxID=2615069 RepID=UPI0006F84428|nr:MULTISPECIES: hypothetical protein [unclassified Nocardioides]KQW48913.1 hypothetical protein ASC77_09340 [Nocardioides sp. Root1257]KRC48088.1 hypothetical protein ASE24_09345 [Nocardioides sp. Root224]
MTVVVGIQTTDGLVLASDSATTQQLALVGGGYATSSIWNSANKIFNLRKSWPIGAMTFGRAAIGGLSIATHAKDLRLRLSGAMPDTAFPALDDDTYSVEKVAQTVLDYYRNQSNLDPGDDLGFIVGGFSATERRPEMWQVNVSESGDTIECVVAPGDPGIVTQGMTDAITRLVDGAGLGLGAALEKMGVPAGSGDAAAEQLRDQLRMAWAWPGMPLGETIDMARFLVETQINFVRFMPGDAMVGGPVEVAALTKHEGFKWVQRKHYYNAKLNPEEGEGL